jgi:hypothetical protein
MVLYWLIDCLLEGLGCVKVTGSKASELEDPQACQCRWSCHLVFRLKRRGEMQEYSSEMVEYVGPWGGVVVLTRLRLPLNRGLGGRDPSSTGRGPSTEADLQKDRSESFL